MCGGDLLRRVAAAALPHINLLLAVYGGAALVMSARLKWDPSVYIPLRELLPAEYHVGVLTLPSLALTLLMLGHLAQVATPLGRGLLCLYAALMVALLVAEVVFVMLVWQRVEEWLRSPAAIAFANMQRELSEHLLPLLEALSRIYPLPTKLNDLIAEAKEDLPRNGYVAAVAAVLLLLLQIAAAAAALLLANRAPYDSTRRSFTHASRHSGGGAGAEERALRAYAFEHAVPAGPARRGTTP